MTRSRTIISVVASLALGPLTAGPALGALSASPNPSTTGSYTVSDSSPPTLPADVSNAFFDRSYYYNLVETPPSGSAQSYDLGRGPVSQAFTGKAAGSYTYQLQTCVYTYQETEPEPIETTVCTDRGSSLTVTVTSAPVNTAPVAEAGTDRTVNKRASVSLDGSGSSDADNDTLTYSWSQTSGTNVTLSGATTSSPSFTAPASTGALVFSLKVNDGKVDSAADSVTVTVTNTAPVANAGTNKFVTEGRSVTLNGSGTDVDKDPLTYVWKQDSGTDVALGSTAAAALSFTAPELLATETLVFSLKVNDGTVDSAADTVTVRVIANNDRPTANAGSDQEVDAGDTVTLSGSGTDPERQPLRYSWSQSFGTGVTLSSTTAASPTFTAPSTAGRLVFSLRVNDGVNDSLSSDSVTITVREVPPPNRAPVANAGTDQTVNKRASVSLDGSSSSDADNDALKYSWSQTSGTDVTLSGATTSSPSFTAPASTGALVFSLTVNDGKVNSAADSVTVTVTNTAPVANAGTNKSVTEGSSVTLNGSGTDVDRDPLSYTWRQTSGTTVTLSSTTAASPSFTAPPSAGTLVFSLTVNDGTVDSTADTVAVTVTSNALTASPNPSRDGNYTVSGSLSPVRTYESYRLEESGSASGTYTVPDLGNISRSFTAKPAGTYTYQAQGCRTYPSSRVRRLRCFDIGTGVTVTVVPATPGGFTASPNPSTTGDYTLSWNASTGATSYALETFQNSAWTAVTLAAPTDTSRAFTNRPDGSYRYRVKACIGAACSTPSGTVTVSVDTNPTNSDPVADAGTDRTGARAVTEGDPVTLDGTGSSDPDAGDTLTYAWTKTSGPDVTLTNADKVSASFTAPDLRGNADLVFTLTVSDNHGAKDTDTVTVRVLADDDPPTAEAGPNQSVATGATVRLNGSGTDPDGDDADLQYAWTQAPGTNVTLSSTAVADPTFTAPPNAATLGFTLSVSDGVNTATDTVTVTVTSNALTASPNPSPDGNYAVSGTISTPLRLQKYHVRESGSASGTYPVSDLSNISLSFTSKPAGTYTYQTQGCRVNPRPRSPEICTDIGGSVEVIVIPATPTGFSASPNPSTTGDYTLSWNASTGATSYALETFENSAWTAVTLAAPSDTSKAFTNRPDGSYDYRVKACIGTECSDVTDTLTVMVDRPNRPPVANAGPDQTDANAVTEGDPVTLAGSGSDPDTGDTLTYKWTKPEGSTFELTDADKATASFTAPELRGNTDLVFTLKVSDDHGAEDTDTVTVHVLADDDPPIVDADENQRVSPGASVTLDGSATDPEGQPLTYAWTQTSGPAVTLTGADMATASFTAPSSDATLEFSLAVSDGFNTVTDTVTVVARPVRRPIANAGEDQRAQINTPVRLSGSGMDAGGNPLGIGASYAWTHSHGALVQLQGANTSTPSFTTPGVFGALEFSLTVNDGTASSLPDTVKVNVGTPSRDPSISSLRVRNGQASYFVVWRQSAGAAASKGYELEERPANEGVDAEVTTYTLDRRLLRFTKNAGGTFEYRARACQGEPGTANRVCSPWTGWVSVTVELPPEAPTIEGPESSADGDYGISWDQPGGATGYKLRERHKDGAWSTPEDLTDTSKSFMNGAPADAGLWAYQVQACNDYGCSAWSATHEVQVNAVPVANGGGNRTVEEGATVVLDGSASTDADAGDTLSYTWTYKSGPVDASQLRLENSDDNHPAKKQFTAPNRLADYTLTFELVVNDGKADSEPATVVISVNANVETDTEPAFGLAAYVPAKTWAPNLAIATFTVPAATGGNSPLSYSASGLPNGVSMSTTTREVSGTPTTSGTGTATITVTDFDGDTDTLTFGWSVTAEDPMPDFGTASVGAQGWSANQQIAAFTVPAASGGDGTLTYTAIGLPYGVTMSSARQVSGTPLFASSGTATVTARDADGDTDTLSFDWTVAATDLMPDYSSASVAQPSWARNQGIVAVTVPAATGGNTPLSYSATGLPAGIAMSTARTLSGTPTSLGTGTATVTVTDADGDTDTFTFDWAVVADDLMPAFGAATIPNQGWIADKEITAFTAPAATGGNAPLVYGAHGLPAGVVLLNSMQFEGTPTATGSGTATVAARDADGDLAKVSFKWTVTANAQPSFGTSTVSSQSWTAGQAITALTVPSASGGNGTLSYGVAGLPEGVTLSPTLQLSGTPLATGSGAATVTARDADGDTATLTFNWSVASPDGSGSGMVLSVSPNPPASANYTVSGAYTGTRSYSYFTLFETNPAGHATSFHHGSVPFSQSIANRVDGAYTYRLEGCYFKRYQNFPEVYEVCETVGDTLAVTVDGPDPDSVGTQLGYTFQARVNNTNPANATAIFIDRTSSATGGGVFQDIVLRKSGNAFELVDPGSVTGTAPGSWSTTTAVDLVLNDINLDGFVDILVRGLGGAITGALDQIVYAPGRSGGSPVILNAVDSSLTNFLSEVSSWTRDPTYFQRHQKPGEVTVTVYRPDCFNAESRRFCSSIPTVVIEVSGARPTNKSSEAREFAQQFSLVDGRINPDVTLGSQSARNLSRILEDVLGEEFLKGNLERSCPQMQTMVVFDQFEIWCDNVTAFGRMIIDLIAGTDRKVNDAPQPGRGLNEREIEFLEGYGPLESGTFSYNELRIVPRSREFFRDNDATHSRAYVTSTEPHIINVRNSDYKESYDPAKIEDVVSLGVILHEVTHTCQVLCEGWVHGRHPMERGMQYVYRVLNTPLSTDLNFEVLGRDQQAEIIHDRMRTNEGLQPARPGNVLMECVEQEQPPGTGCVNNEKRAVPISVVRDELNGLSIPGAVTIPPDSD